MSDQTTEPTTDAFERVIDWTAVEPGSPDVTPDACPGGECDPSEHCDVMLATQQAADMLQSGIPPFIVQAIAGPLAFCSRDAHDGEDDVHAAGDGSIIICVWTRARVDNSTPVAPPRWAPAYLAKHFDVPIEVIGTETDIRAADDLAQAFEAGTDMLGTESDSGR
jgi:hypothetical protein